MKAYIRLQEGKARKKACKEKKKAARLAAGLSTGSSTAHSFSPSSQSSLDIGEVSSAFDPAVNVPIDNLDLDIGEGINFKRQDSYACSPSANPLPVGDVGQLGQDSVVLCGNSSLAKSGNVDPAPSLMEVAEENPAHTGQPPQSLASSQIGEGFKTPSVSGTSRVSAKSGSFKLTPMA